MQDLTGRKLVANAPLKWTRDGQLVAIEPGDIFEVDARDVEIAGIRFDLWLSAGVVTLHRAAPAKTTASQQERTGDGEEAVNAMVDTPAPERPGRRPLRRSDEGAP